ncbi:ankyrin repeat domain-containing protein [Planococcus sp. ANT_H30]|nr:ankyrin repeat domain-containing protein [Planococcus sp. ANT_H30]
MHWAVQEECVRLLIKNGANIKMRTFSCATPLYIACGEGNAKLADYLIQQGANVNEQVGQDDKTTPMMLASMYNYLQVVEVFLKYEGDMEIKDEEGKIALFHAAKTDSKEIIKLLLKKGAKKTIVSKSGKKLTDILNGDQNNNNMDFEGA